MTSEIKVDTISEQTSANGVTIDGLTIKDGNIIGDVALAGTTPTFTIGDGGAEDAALIFDGNAVDYYMALDDSADNLIIGSGSTVGSNSLITIDSDGDFTLDSAGDIILDADGGDIKLRDGGSGFGQIQNSSSDLVIQVDTQDKDIIFKGDDGGSLTTLLTLDTSAAGAATFNSQITSGSHIVIPATSRLYLDGSGDTFIEEVSGNTIAITTNNSERMRIHSAGNISIGSTSDPAKLSVTTASSGVSPSSNADELFIEGNDNAGMTIGSGTSGAGNIYFGDSGDNDIGIIRYGHGDNAFLFNTNANTNFGLSIRSDNKISTNAETSPDCGVGGLTLNQGAFDDKILTFKSSDVGHGMTDVAETDTYAVFTKRTSDGGLHIKGLHDSGDQGIRIEAMCVTENTTKGTTGNAPMHLISAKKNSAGLQQFGSNANLFVVSNNGSTKFIVDAEGELHSDGGAQSAYDTYEDAQLVRAYDLSHGKGVIDSKFDDYIKYNHESLAEAGLVGREKDGTPNNFINVTGMQRLHNGAIWQQYEKHQRLAEAVYEMAKEALGKDKADAILNKHDIKLLN